LICEYIYLSCMHNFKLSQSVYPLSCLKDLKTYSPAQFATRRPYVLILSWHNHKDASKQPSMNRCRLLENRIDSHILMCSALYEWSDSPAETAESQGTDHRQNSHWCPESHLPHATFLLTHGYLLTSTTRSYIQLNNVTPRYSYTPTADAEKWHIDGNNLSK